MAKFNVDRKSNCIFVSLPISDNTVSVSNNTNNEFPLSYELSLQNYKHIECRFCSNTIHNVSKVHKIDKLFGLPSQYWLELSELWFCCTQHQMEFDQTKEIVSKPNMILIGKLHCVLHPINIIKDSVILKPIINHQHNHNNNDEMKMKETIKNETREKIKHHCCAHGDRCGHNKNNNGENEDDVLSFKNRFVQVGTNSADDLQSELSFLSTVDSHLNDNKDEELFAMNCYCKRCYTLIGTAFGVRRGLCKDKENKNENTNSNEKKIENEVDNESMQIREFHLWKHELKVGKKNLKGNNNNKNNNTNIYKYYELETYFSTKMIELNDARMTHKFLICDFNETIYIQCIVLTFDCLMKNDLKTSDNEYGMIPIIKLLYSCNEKEKQKQEKKEKINNLILWIKQVKGEIIQTSFENCKQLQLLVCKNHSLCPPIVRNRQFGHRTMKLSYLNRLNVV